MDLGEDLGEVQPRKMVNREGAVKKTVVLRHLPVIAEEHVETKAEIDHIILLERVVEHEVVLVAHPLVGQAIREDREILAVARNTTGIAVDAVLDPAVDADLTILEPQGTIEQKWGW